MKGGSRRLWLTSRKARPCCGGRSSLARSLAEGDIYGLWAAGLGAADNSHFLVAAELIAPSFEAAMARDVIILECTEARAEGKQASQYVTTRNKKSLNTPGRLEKVKFNFFLKRRTLHRERR